MLWAPWRWPHRRWHLRRTRTSPPPGPRAAGGGAPPPMAPATYENLSAGRDFCGPNPAVQTQDAWVERGRSVTSQPAPRNRRLSGTITGLSDVTVAADRGLPGT